VKIPASVSASMPMSASRSAVTGNRISETTAVTIRAITPARFASNTTRTRHWAHKKGGEK